MNEIDSGIGGVLVYNRVMGLDFLPTNRDEMKLIEWDELDILLITGDAYVDHPSFGTPLIGRILEANGFRVGLIPQPDWKSNKDFKVMGAPRLFVAVSAGNLDSMIANYSSEKHLRREDAYSEGGAVGFRPDRACLVYTNRVRECFPGVPVILGGIEASLRRLVHYDYWDNRLRKSILFDSKADLIVYGMAERSIVEVANRLSEGKSLEGIRGTAYLSKESKEDHSLVLPAWEALQGDKKVFAEMTLAVHRELSKKHPRRVVQACGGRWVVCEPPMPLLPEDLESIPKLPFTRKTHPRYIKQVPANGFVQDSIVSHRGCYGGCTFCTLTVHQGKYIVSRSEESIIEEARLLTNRPGFKGNILDVGGPSANMYGSVCTKEEGCQRLSCLVPDRCSHLEDGQNRLIPLYQTLRKIKYIKRVFINSGIRHDLALTSPKYCEELISHHVGGQLSLAPEHSQKTILKRMMKPTLEVYERFLKVFSDVNKLVNKEQYIVPYVIAAFPGSSLEDAYQLAKNVRSRHGNIEQVQTFIPIPMTIASAMYYAQWDPLDRTDLHIPTGEERLLQRALLQPKLRSNWGFVKKALQQLGKAQEYEQFIGLKKMFKTEKTGHNNKRRGTKHSRRSAS